MQEGESAMAGRNRLVAALAAFVVAALTATAAPAEAADGSALQPLRLDLDAFRRALGLDLQAAESRQRGATGEDARVAAGVVTALTDIRDDYRKRRAEEVKAWLEALGVTCRELKTLSFGKERPAALLSEPACWNLNRRAAAYVASAGAQ